LLLGSPSFLNKSLRKQDERSIAPALMRYLMSLMACLILLSTTLPVLTGCGSVKPVPVAEGHDPVVVNAERVQGSTLDIYKLVIDWEKNNRHALPVEVSRGVDQVRKEFPPAWKQSREALKEYKAGTGPGASDIERATTALEIFSTNMLALKKNGDPNEIARVMSSLTSLVNSVRQLTTKSPATTNTVTNPN